MGFSTLYDLGKSNNDWLIYDMNGKKGDLGQPSKYYYDMIAEGYRDFGLDDWYLRAAAKAAELAA